MPTASDEQRNLMNKWFGSPIDENGPIKFLESHGFILNRNWLWSKPTSAYTVSDDEWECLNFLIDEWDFGGIDSLNGL